MNRLLVIGAVALALGLTLAGCGKQAGNQSQSDAAVAVLPGSASDAMIAYDTLRSQPPKAAAEADEAGGTPRAARPAQAPGDDTDTADAPVAEPQPQPAAAAPSAAAD